MARAIVSWDTVENGGWKMEDVEVREPEEGELLVEMVGSGVCHTDALIGGLPAGAAPIAFYPRVLGHEGILPIYKTINPIADHWMQKVGKGVTVAKEGDSVLLSYAFCNDCAICKAGSHSHCPRFTELNFAGPFNVFKVPKRSNEDVSGVFFGQSSFANLSIVKQCSVVNVTDIVKDKRELQLFSPLGCGIQTGSGTVINAAKAGPDDVIFVMGLGGVGLSAVMGAKIAGARMIIGLDRVESRLALAKELGATHTIDGSKLGDKPLVEAVQEVAEGMGPTVTIDTTGVPALIKAGIAATRPKGRYCQVGSPPFDLDITVNAFEFMMSGKQLLGAIEGQAYPPEYVPKMIQWYREGRFPIDKMMKLIPADDYQQALKEMHDGVTIKPVLCWS